MHSWSFHGSEEKQTTSKINEITNRDTAREGNRVTGRQQLREVRTHCWHDVDAKTCIRRAEGRRDRAAGSAVMKGCGDSVR